MEFVRTLLVQQPLMALFLVIAIGYLVGEINVKGFSLGVGAVLFVALAMGWFAPKSAPAPMVGTLGLALFLYGVGIQYGKQFFVGLVSPAGRRANLLALIGVLSAGAVSLVFVQDPGHRSRLCTGPVRGFGDQHADAAGGDATLGNDNPAVGYSVVLSVRRGRADPVPLPRVHGPEAEDRGAHGLGSGDARDRAAQSGAGRQDAG